MVFNGFCSLRWLPERPKSTLKRPQEGLEEVLFRCSILSSILVRFGSRFDPILGPQIVHLGARFWYFFWMSPQEAPKRLPRGTQEAPKSPQEAPKRP